MTSNRVEESVPIRPALRTRFGYMFGHPGLQDSMPAWWVPRFTDLCGEIDAILGTDKRGFHWRQLKEKLGTGRYYWSLTPWDLSQHPTALVDAIQTAIKAADADLYPASAR